MALSFARKAGMATAAAVAIGAVSFGASGTDYRAWAVAIPNGKTISAVDQYDKRHHRLTHDTYWR
ncbi:hypothetical protein [Actinacidiphila glaucinigra]